MNTVRFSLIMSVTLLVAGIGITYAGNPHGLHEPSDSQPVNGTKVPPGTLGPAETVDRFFQLLAAGDVKGASALLDPQVLIFESGSVERSREEYAAHHLGEDAEFLKSAKYRMLARSGDSAGDLAWVATEAQLETESHDKRIDLVTTETMILRKDDDGWRIVHIHWSSRKGVKR